MIAIDPGPVSSAYVIFIPSCGPAGPPGELLAHEILDNEILLKRVLGWGYTVKRPAAGSRGPLVVEMVRSYGRPVGEETFETVFWIGRFFQAWGRSDRHRIDRQTIKQRLCPGGPASVNDAVLRQRLIDLWGGRGVAVGVKAAPGPLYRVRKDEWAALAVAVAWSFSAGETG